MKENTKKVINVNIVMQLKLRKFQQEFVKDRPNNDRSKLFQQNIKTIKKIIRRLSAIRSGIRSDAISKLTKEYKLRDSGEFGYLQALIYIYIHQMDKLDKKYNTSSSATESSASAEESS